MRSNKMKTFYPFLLLVFLTLSFIIFKLSSELTFYKNSFNKSFVYSLKSANTHSEAFVAWIDEIIRLKAASPKTVSDLYFHFQTTVDELENLNSFSENANGKAHIPLEPYVKVSAPLNDLIGRSLNTGKTVTLSDQDIDKLKEMEKPFQILVETIKIQFTENGKKKYSDDTILLKNNDWNKILKEIETKSLNTK